MAFFNLTQLGPQNLFKTASNLPDEPATSKFSSSGREQKPAGMGSSGTLHCGCSKVTECTPPPSIESVIDTTGDQTVTLHITDEVGKTTETTTSTSKGRAEFHINVDVRVKFQPLKPLLRSHFYPELRELSKNHDIVCCFKLEILILNL